VEREDLLQPVLAAHERRPTGYRPWRLQSQIYVGFFGGAPAVGVIAYANAVMLGMSIPARMAIAALALGAEAALLTVAALTEPGVVRLGHLVAGLAVYGGAYLIQRSADRVYHFHTAEDEPYTSLFGAGLVACILGRIVDAALAEAVAG
jgi:hypothetical protein